MHVLTVKSNVETGTTSTRVTCWITGAKEGDSPRLCPAISAVVASCFLRLKTQATRLRIDKMTKATRLPIDKMTNHQCQNVCDWKTTEGDQPHANIQSQENQPTDCVHDTFRKEVHILFSAFQAVHTNKVAQKKGRVTLVPGANHVETVSKIRRKLASQHNSTRSFLSPHPSPSSSQPVHVERKALLL